MWSELLSFGEAVPETGSWLFSARVVGVWEERNGECLDSQISIRTLQNSELCGLFHKEVYR